MSPKTKLQIAELSDLTIGELTAKYEKLTAVARAATGSHCNGFLFFKLGQKK